MDSKPKSAKGGIYDQITAAFQGAFQPAMDIYNKVSGEYNKPQKKQPKSQKLPFELNNEDVQYIEGAPQG